MDELVGFHLAIPQVEVLPATPLEVDQCHLASKNNNFLIEI